MQIIFWHGCGEIPPNLQGWLTLREPSDARTLPAESCRARLAVKWPAQEGVSSRHCRLLVAVCGSTGVRHWGEMRVDLRFSLKPPLALWSEKRQPSLYRVLQSNRALCGSRSQKSQGGRRDGAVKALPGFSAGGPGDAQEGRWRVCRQPVRQRKRSFRLPSDVCVCER